MTRSELLAFFNEKTSAARDLMSRKNQDYAEVDEVFGNLNVCELLNIVPAEQGILIRMTDKLRRLISLTKRDAAVKDESFEDTCLDLINYTILLMARRSQRGFAVREAAQPTQRPIVDTMGDLKQAADHGGLDAYQCRECRKTFHDLPSKWIFTPPHPICFECRDNMRKSAVERPIADALKAKNIEFGGQDRPA